MLDVDALYRRHAPYIERTLRRGFNSSVPDVLIEDACASTWMIAWAKRRDVQEDNVIGWLITVARREVLALLRKRGVERPLEEVSEPAELRARPEVVLEAKQTLSALAGLSANQRNALSLRAAGCTYREVAVAAGKTYTWANRHITEGRAAMRKLAGGSV